MQKNLHIVAFNVPYPPNYGGVIDIFYKLRALHKQEVNIYLHCFDDGRGKKQELEKYCERVYYYKMRKTFLNTLSYLPNIVVSRKNKKLIKNLLTVYGPIIFEGLHCCYYLSHPKLKNRIRVVRAHNIEHDYYSANARSSKNIFEKLFNYFEAFKLKLYENEMLSADKVLSISFHDQMHFYKKFHNASLIPAFHSCEAVEIKKGKGDYVLFHADLSVEENIAAAEFLLTKVLYKGKYKIIFAGKDPDPEFAELVREYSFASLISNPDEAQMLSLIQDAQVIILYALNSSGLKLKLVYSLYYGRHVIANHCVTENSGLVDCVIPANTKKEIRRAVGRIFDTEFTEDLIEQRRNILTEEFSNEKNAEKIVDIVFPPRE